jgi:hypothetical protein
MPESHAQQRCPRNLCRARGIEHELHNVLGLEYPQVPAVADLALTLDEHLPARLVGMPVRLRAQLRRPGLAQWLEQPRQLPQAVRDRALRDAQALIGPLVQQAVRGLPVGELGQQHVHPYRYAQLASRNQPRRQRRGDDARQAGALARGPIAPAPDHAPVGLDLQLDDLTVLGARKLFEALPALRTDRGVQSDRLAARRQLMRLPAPVARACALLASGAPRTGLRMPCRRDEPRLLCTRAKHPLAQIADLRLSQRQFLAQARLSKSGLLDFLAVASLGPQRTCSRTLMQRLVLLGRHHQLNMRLLAQRHRLRGERGAASAGDTPARQCLIARTGLPRKHRRIHGRQR